MNDPFVRAAERGRKTYKYSVGRFGEPAAMAVAVTVTKNKAGAT